VSKSTWGTSPHSPAAIVGGRVVTIEAGVIDRGTIVFSDGLITAVGGPDTSLPAGTDVVDAEGKWVLPGFIDAHTHLGVHEEGDGWAGWDTNELTDPVTAHVRALDAINPADLGFRDAIEGGVLAVNVNPGSGNPIGGLTVAMRCFGRVVDEMVLRHPSGCKSALGENPKRVYEEKKQTPSTRLGTAAIIREAFTKARDYDGVFDFVPRAARPKVGRPPFGIGSYRNFDIGAGQGRLHVINDNAGRLFHLSAEPWARGAMVDVGAANGADEKHAASIGRRPGMPLAATAAVVTCALAAISETDMMLLGVRDYGPGRAADPRTPAGRAALYSLAFMLRRAAAVYLDIGLRAEGGYQKPGGSRPRLSGRPGVSLRHARKRSGLRNASGTAGGQRAASADDRSEFALAVSRPARRCLARGRLRHVMPRLPAQLQQPRLPQPSRLAARDRHGEPRIGRKQRNIAFVAALDASGRPCCIGARVSPARLYARGLRGPPGP